MTSTTHDRSTYVKRASQTLDEWGLKLDELKTRAEREASDAKTELSRRVEDLGAARDQAELRLKHAKSQADEHWSAARDDAEHALTEFRNGVARAFEDLRS